MLVKTKKMMPITKLCKKFSLKKRKKGMNMAESFFITHWRITANIAAVAGKIVMIGRHIKNHRIFNKKKKDKTSSMLYSLLFNMFINITIIKIHFFKNL